MTYRDRMYQRWENEDEAYYRRHVLDETVKSYDIGGVFALVLSSDDSNLQGYYKNHTTGMTFQLDCDGLTRGKIIRMMWDKAREIKPELEGAV
ncbi:gp163 [Bacillus phage W.Ph.]|uniref:Gp163 n=1 Tax=Bacillus phage W.Ph. TaxID=764595 RepID=G9B1R4_9CAUD|nr:gp163 [Bacillus phage W.Ph.]ADH03309.1 gp163 [Bacillus phage W.Ph.]